MNILYTYTYILFLLTSVLIVPYVSAQSITPQSTGRAYPIAELGNCSSRDNCRVYCDDPVHKTTCSSYAVKMGLITPIPTVPDSLTLQMMKSLGCTSKESCKSFCSETTHYDACSAAAKKFNIKGGYVLDKTVIATKLMTVLNNAGVKACTSYESCKIYCDQPEHRGECSAAAKQSGLNGGSSLKGPGGCSSVESCKQYCDEHPSECRVIPRITQQTELNDDQLKTMCSVTIEKRPALFGSGERYKRLCITTVPTRIPQRTGTPRILRASPVSTVSLSPDKENTSGSPILPTIKPAINSAASSTPTPKQYYQEVRTVTLIPSRTPTPTVRIYTPAEQQYYLEKTGVTMTPSPTRALLQTTSENRLEGDSSVKGVMVQRSIWEKIVDYLFVQSSRPN